MAVRVRRPAGHGTQVSHRAALRSGYSEAAMTGTYDFDLVAIGSGPAGQRVAGGVEHVLHQIVGQRTGRYDALLRERDSGRLHGADQGVPRAQQGFDVVRHGRESSTNAAGGILGEWRP